mmetsp:Transcript_21181/g.58794  ORF Transcript_21181/g.58794 Transcript_21181/m.58794 type:complete len:263 (-) Transcript_21181:2134-2922(-)
MRSVCRVVWHMGPARGNELGLILGILPGFWNVTLLCLRVVSIEAWGSRGSSLCRRGLCLNLLRPPGGPADGEAGPLKDVLEVVLLDRVREAWDLQDAYSSSILEEVVREQLRVRRCRHQYHLDTAAPGDEVSQEEQEEVALYTALMHLVHHHVGEPRQLRVSKQPPQQNTYRTKEKTGPLRTLGLKAHRVAHGGANGLASLCSHTGRQPHGADAPWLGANDVAGGTVALGDPLLEQELRHLSAFPAACCATDDQDLGLGSGL